MFGRRSIVPLKKRQHGFTFVELLLATVVFATILLVVTVGIIQITKVYYKGVTESTTQNAARSIMDTISQGIQFSGGDVTETPAATTPGASYAFCIGNQQYSFTTGFQMVENVTPGPTQTNHAVVSNVVSGCNASTPAQNVRNATVNGRELLNPKMRIAQLSVRMQAPNVYRVSLKVVHGDDDLLDNPTTTNAKCKNATVGTQFCAVSDLSTVVTKRVQ